MSDKNYFDTRDCLPDLDKIVWIFFENCAYNGWGYWNKAIRISDAQFVFYDDVIIHKHVYKADIDFTDRHYIGVGVTHWAELTATNLPNLDRSPVSNNFNLK